MDQETILENKELNIIEALIPLFALIAMLSVNVWVMGDDGLSGSNQLILILGAVVAAIVGHFNKVGFDQIFDRIGHNLKSISGAVLILLLVGALSASWLISGVIPAMIYYGMKLLNPEIFLPVCVIVSAVISIATGSSWTTSATVGIALVAIGRTMDMSAGMVAGAVISGAYFGDKMSPMSDTTNLAAAIAETPLFNHIKYMFRTTVPSIIITLIAFTIMSIVAGGGAMGDQHAMLNAVSETFNVSGWLFSVPVMVIGMILLKLRPEVALLSGVVLGVIAMFVFQQDLLFRLTEGNYDFYHQYKVVMTAVASGIAIDTPNAQLNDLFSSGGMMGMGSTILLIICAMIFGGAMEAIGALSRISKALLKLARSVFGLFASTVASCLALNVTASDQYLAIVVPGKMFKQAYKDRGLAPENLSRTLEDSGTVTSVLVPWNSCGAYQSGVLGVSVAEYAAFAIFNYVSPLMTLIYGAFRIKIKKL